MDKRFVKKETTFSMLTYDYLLKHDLFVSVIARNPKSLSALSSGKASYGARSILDQAIDYVECAKLYPCMYQTPKVTTKIMSNVIVNEC